MVLTLQQKGRGKKEEIIFQKLKRKKYKKFRTANIIFKVLVHPSLKGKICKVTYFTNAILVFILQLNINTYQLKRVFILDQGFRNFFTNGPL